MTRSPVIHSLNKHAPETIKPRLVLRPPEGLPTDTIDKSRLKMASVRNVPQDQKASLQWGHQLPEGTGSSQRLHRSMLCPLMYSTGHKNIPIAPCKNPAGLFHYFHFENKQLRFNMFEAMCSWPHVKIFHCKNWHAISFSQPNFNSFASCLYSQLPTLCFFSTWHVPMSNSSLIAAFLRLKSIINNKVELTKWKRKIF